VDWSLLHEELGFLQNILQEEIGLEPPQTAHQISNQAHQSSAAFYPRLLVRIVLLPA
jgi:hypothetical protein